MLLPRLILIPMLLLAQLASAACGRSLFVWCLGPHGDLKLELPHDECRHDCGDAAGSAEPAGHAEEGLVDPHGCSDIAADMTVPAIRRASAGSEIIVSPDAATPDPPLGVAHLNPSPPRMARARAMLDRPPPALSILRTVRVLV